MPKCIECLIFFGLCINVHRHAGLKFHGEFVLVDSDFFNQHLLDLALQYRPGIAELTPA